MQNRPEKYLSVTAMLEEDVNTTVAIAYQKGIPHVGNGICGGLSVVHILKQLQSRTLSPHNPFEHHDDLEVAFNIQKNCDDKTGCIKNVLDKNKPFKSCNTAGLEEKLIKKIERTEGDERNRGIYISTIPNRNPRSGEALNSMVRHDISMTIQKYNNQLFCTGMDSNFFFATGKNAEGCKVIAKKMAQTVNAYDATGIYTCTVNMPSSIEDGPSIHNLLP